MSRIVYGTADHVTEGIKPRRRDSGPARCRLVRVTPLPGGSAGDQPGISKRAHPLKIKARPTSPLAAWARKRAHQECPPETAFPQTRGHLASGAQGSRASAPQSDDGNPSSTIYPVMTRLRLYVPAVHTSSALHRNQPCTASRVREPVPPPVPVLRAWARRSTRAAQLTREALVVSRSRPACKRRVPARTRAGVGSRCRSRLVSPDRIHRRVARQRSLHRNRWLFAQQFLE